MTILKYGLLVAVSMLAFALPAKADYNVWTDVHTGLTLTFPDTWKQQNNQLPIDVITLSLPSGIDDAVCKISAEEDKRFLIYPNKFRGDIQSLYFSKDFWDKYASNFDNVNIIREQDNAGLGQGFASMTLLSFTMPPTAEGLRSPKEYGGLMAVTHYYDKVYVAQCTSTMESYAHYHGAFLSLLKSVSFKKSYHELAVGDYRNFLKEWGTVDVPFPNAVSRSTY